MKKMSEIFKLPLRAEKDADEGAAAAARAINAHDDLVEALKALCGELDKIIGTLPVDPPKAYMDAQAALKKAEA